MHADAHITIPEHELEERFVPSPGPGGQNVNRVATKVQLRFDIARSSSLDDEVRARLVRIAGHRVTTDGVLVIDAHRFRSRERNREDARARLAALIERAARIPKRRRPSRTPAGEKARRLETKRHQGTVKRLRARPAAGDD